MGFTPCVALLKVKSGHSHFLSGTQSYSRLKMYAWLKETSR
jgi:hypothetical protein